MSMDACGDDRFELIEEAKRRLLESTNIEDRPEEVAVLNSILFRFWQMGWLDQLREDGNAGTCHMNKETLDGITTLHCSKCGHELFLEFDRGNDWFAFQYPRFCPNCGKRVVFE